MDRETLRKKIEDEAVHRVKPGDPRLPGKIPGETYEWQFYFRRILYDAKVMNYVADQFAKTFHSIYQQQPFQVAGVESGAVPLLCAIKLTWPEINVYSIRKDQKTYGLLNWIEGVPNTLPTVLVDDLVSASHYTFDHGVKVLGMHDMPLLNQMFVIVNKRYSWEPNFDLVHPPTGGTVVVHSLFTLDSFAMEWAHYNAAK